MAKGEIACFEQFLLLSQCFQKSSAAEASESVDMLERVKRSLTAVDMTSFEDLQQKDKLLIISN